MVNQNVFQKSLYFLNSVNIMRGLLLIPFLSRNAIKLSEILYTKNESKKLSLSPLLIADNDIDDDEKDEKPESTEENQFIDNDNDNPLLPPEESVTTSIQEKSTAPIFTTSALLIEDEKVRKKVVGIIAFHETTELITGSVWQAFLSSLLINAIANFYMYPDEREGATLWDIFGLNSLRDTLCIEEIPFFKANLCYIQNKG